MGKTKEEIESEDSSSEEDDPIISAKSNEGFIKALNALRNNDKRIVFNRHNIFKFCYRYKNKTKIKKLT